MVANSNFTKNLAVSLGVEEKRLIVINPGVDPVEEISKDDLKQAEEMLKGKKQRLITVSRFDKRKNHEKVIMAIRNLKEKYPDITYTCIGYGDEEENLKKLVIELKLDKYVNFLSDISNELKNALIVKSNIFIMPSIIHKTSVEGFGISSTGSTPGFITINLFSSTPRLTAKFFVKFEFATTWSTLFKTSKTFLFNLDPLG